MQDMDLYGHSNHNIAFSEKRKVKIGTLYLNLKFTLSTRF